MSDATASCVCASAEHCEVHYCSAHDNEERPCFVCGFNDRQKELTQAESERERYKAALEVIVQQPLQHQTHEVVSMVMRDIARRALRGEQGEP